MIFPIFVERKQWYTDLLRSIMIFYEFKISILIDLNNIIRASLKTFKVYLYHISLC